MWLLQKLSKEFYIYEPDYDAFQSAYFFLYGHKLRNSIKKYFL